MPWGVRTALRTFSEGVLCRSHLCTFGAATNYGTDMAATGSVVLPEGQSVYILRPGGTTASAL